jgi:hypothetical protein
MTDISRLEDFLDPDNMPPADPIADHAGVENAESIDFDIASEMSRVMSELGASVDSAKIVVMRSVDKNPKNDVWLFECPVEEFSTARLLEYGSGRYHVRGYRRNEKTGVGVKLFLNRVIAVERPPGYVEPSAQSAAQPHHATGTDAVLASILETQRQIAQALTQRPAESSRREMLQELVVMKELFSAPAQAASHAPNPINQLKDMLELVATLKGSEAAAADPTTGLLMTLLNTMGKPLADAIQSQVALKNATMAQAQAQPALARPVQPFATSAPTLTPSPAPQPVQAPGESDMTLKIQMAMQSILAAAKTGQPTKPIAELVADQAPPEFVAGLLDSPQWFEQISQAYPEVAEYRAWFTQLHADLSALYE